MPQNRNVTAVLGPTNTGKTHLAVERMLGHASGMIGLPLRLLAREIYDRVRLRTGDHQVALVTGEEKIIPAQPRYWVCTVEAMPSNIDVSFVAVDEVQLCADLERGHIFTDRLLNRRGREETMLLGAATMRPIMERLLSGTSFVSRPRFSKLSYAGQKKISRLPRRSAIVAFSAEMVYAVAELIRRQRGGAAVVLGALSPRTRNAQVALYQSGDVDYLVATDAIGMGINMDVDHVAFASTRKFDGFGFRQLTAAELGQIAGRAGRHMNDGTFGVTGEAEPFDQETVDRLENHNFESVRMLQWRNRELDFASIERLRQSLGAWPKQEGLTRSQAGPDILAFEALANDRDIAPLASSPQNVARLWEVCQIPDYRNISGGEHAGIVGRIFQFLMTGDGHIPEDWFSRQLTHCDNSEGDIDTLSNRISHIRTWTFVANRADWLAAPLFWQQRAREIEDKLSDALHERLSQRFIDRRTSVLMRRLAQRGELMSTVEEDGAVHVEGEYVGRIKGFHFIPDGSEGAHGKTLKTASLQAVAQEIVARAKAVAASADPDLSLSRTGDIIWQNATIGKLKAGASALKPRIEVVADNQLSGTEREEVQARLHKFIDRHIAKILEPLVKLEDSEGLEGVVRGLAFRLVETLGILPRDQVINEVKALSQEDRAKLRAFGVRFGAFNIYVPILLKPAATELRLLLWALGLEREGKLDLAALPQPPGQGLTSAPFDRTTPRGFYGVCGYRICGPRVVRIDMLERLADLIRDRVFWRARFAEQPRPAGSVEGGGFTIIPEMMSLVGCSGEEFQAILRSLDFRMQRKKIKKPALVLPPTEAPVKEEPAVSSSSETPPAEQAETTDSEVSPFGEEDQAAISEPAETAEALKEEPVQPPAGEQAAEPTKQPEQLEGEELKAQPDDNQTEQDVGKISEVPAAPPATEEEIEIEVWWPKDTGPFRRMPEKKQHRPQRPKQAKPQNQEKPAEPEKKSAPPQNQQRPPQRPNRPRPQPKPEKPVDPDSPFAILSALKGQFAKK